MSWWLSPPWLSKIKNSKTAKGGDRVTRLLAQGYTQSFKPRRFPRWFSFWLPGGSLLCRDVARPKLFERVRTRVVVVVVRELLFLVTSVICVRIRGRGSEVTTISYHFCSDFRLQLRSYRSGFVGESNPCLPRYLSCKHNTYGYSV